MSVKSNYFGDYKLWHRFMLQALDNKKWSKHYFKIYLNLKIVNVGIKPSLLWDFGSVPPILTLSSLICQLKDKCLLEPFIFICSIGSELFIVNKISINNVLSTNNFFKFMNLDSANDEKQISENNTIMLLKLQKLISKESKENESFNSTLTDFGCPKLFGILLGYPVVFNVNANEECSFLNNSPLINVKIFFDLFEKSNEIYSFSYFPDGDLSKHVDKWFNHLKVGFKDFNLKISKQRVSFSNIIL